MGGRGSFKFKKNWVVIDGRSLLYFETQFKRRPSIGKFDIFMDNLMEFGLNFSGECPFIIQSMIGGCSLKIPWDLVEKSIKKLKRLALSAEGCVGVFPEAMGLTPLP
jgi:hypothetical protein